MSETGSVKYRDDTARTDMSGLKRSLCTALVQFSSGCPLLEPAETRTISDLPSLMIDLSFSCREFFSRKGNAQ